MRKTFRKIFEVVPAWKFGVATLAFILLAFAARHYPVIDWANAFGEWSGSYGVAGALIFGCIIGVAATLLLPCLPLTLLAGFSFGWLNGLLAVMTGVAIGATIGFFVGRYIARDAVARLMGDNPRFRAIDRAIAADGWKIVGLLRMLPVPFGVTNYFYGLTPIDYPRYMAATLAGMLPGNMMFVYLGAFGKRTLDGPRHPLEYVMGGFTIAAMVGVIILLRRMAKRTAEAKAERGEPQAQT